MHLHLLHNNLLTNNIRKSTEDEKYRRIRQNLISLEKLNIVTSTFFHNTKGMISPIPGNSSSFSDVWVIASGVDQSSLLSLCCFFRLLLCSKKVYRSWDDLHARYRSNRPLGWMASLITRARTSLAKLLQVTQRMYFVMVRCI